MPPNPGNFLEHLRQLGYHPRSDKHSNCLSCCLVADLLAHCPAVRRHAAEGELVFDLNFTLHTGTAEWNVDLVLGEPAPAERCVIPDGEMRRATPSTVRVAVEHKAVMTEHHKAVKNRKRDFEAHHDRVHRYSTSAIAGGILIVNGASAFRSPLRSEVTEHRAPVELVAHCVDQMRAVSERQGDAGNGMDVKSVIVVDMDNQELSSTRFVTAGAAPKIGDPLHYDAFVQRLCRLYTERFAR